MTFDIIKSMNQGSPRSCNLILWNSNFEDHKKNIYSVIIKLESKKESFRKQFYDFIFSVSKTKVLNKTLEKFLELEDGLSFFWFSSLGQRDIYENSKILELLKFFALKEILENNKITKLNLNLNLEECIHEQLIELLEFKKIRFCSNIKPKKNNYLEYNNVFYSFLYSLYFFSLRINFLNNKNTNSNIALFDFLLEKRKVSYSKYFTLLPQLLVSSDKKFKISHLFYKKDFKNLFHTDFNFFSKTDHIIDREINLKILFKVLRNLHILNKKKGVLAKELNCFCEEKSGVNFNKLLKEDFIRSLTNRSVIRGLFYNELIKKYLNKNESLKIGIYPLENQPWENILVSNWKKIKKSKIYGMVHTTVRFWDLRMYYGENYKIIGQILPENILSNSIYSTRNLVEGGFNKEMIIETEALRYLKKDKKREKIKLDQNKILICGDFSEKLNKHLIQFNNNLLRDNFSVDFLQHPTLTKNLEISNQIFGDLIEILEDYSIVITSSISSSGVDAYENSKFVFQFVQDEGLNFSVLRGFENVIFFNNYKELKEELKNLKLVEKHEKKYFHSDINLKMWTKFFNNL